MLTDEEAGANSLKLAICFTSLRFLFLTLTIMSGRY